MNHDADGRAAVVMFGFLHTVLTVMIIIGFVLMMVMKNLMSVLIWTEIGLGFLWNLLLLVYFFPEKKRLGLLFGLIALILGLILLDGVLNLLA